MTMDAATRSRLEKLLGMLGSTFDGERANAARMIAAMAERENKTIAELVLGSSGPTPYVFRQAYADPPPERPRKAKPQTTTILDALKEIAASGDELEFTITAWEFGFAGDVGEKYDFDYELTERQIAAAQRIIDKVEKARARGKPA